MMSLNHIHTHGRVVLNGVEFSVTECNLFKDLIAQHYKVGGGPIESFDVTFFLINLRQKSILRKFLFNFFSVGDIL